MSKKQVGETSSVVVVVVRLDTVWRPREVATHCAPLRARGHSGLSGTLCLPDRRRLNPSSSPKTPSATMSSATWRNVFTYVFLCPRTRTFTLLRIGSELPTPRYTSCCPVTDALLCELQVQQVHPDCGSRPPCIAQGGGACCCREAWPHHLEVPALGEGSGWTPGASLRPLHVSRW